MKNALLVIAITVITISCSKEESIDIYIPENCSQEKIISEIKAIPSSERNYADFSQLAISYAAAGESPTIIKFWLEKSFEDNAIKTCELLSFLENNQSDWAIIANYSNVITPLIKGMDCLRATK
jgi:hypothetical protein